MVARYNRMVRAIVQLVGAKVRKGEMPVSPSLAQKATRMGGLLQGHGAKHQNSNFACKLPVTPSRLPV